VHTNVFVSIAKLQSSIVSDILPPLV